MFFFKTSNILNQINGIEFVFSLFRQSTLHHIRNRNIIIKDSFFLLLISIDATTIAMSPFSHSATDLVFRTENIGIQKN